MKKAILFAVFIFFFNNLISQVTIIRGNVHDRNTTHGLQNITIAVGGVGTITDENGNFNLTTDLSLLMNKGIKVTAIGYQSQHLIYQPNYFYYVELQVDNIKLKEVVVYDAKSIIKKAYYNITRNYPSQPTLITGILRTESIRNNSNYFNSDAILKAFVPPYRLAKIEKISVVVIQNKLDTIIDKSLPYLREVEDYNIVDKYDFIHSQKQLKRMLLKGNFSYIVVGKQIFNNRKVYIINGLLKDSIKNKKNIDVVLYIDTATYAFAAVNVDQYNIKRFGFVDVDKESYNVVYNLQGIKWHLKEIILNSSFDFKKETPTSKEVFICTQIENVEKNPFGYKDIIQEHDDVGKIDKPGDLDVWKSYNSLFKKAEEDGRIFKRSKLFLDTIKQNNLSDKLVLTDSAKQKIAQTTAITNYITNGSIKSIMPLSDFL